MSNASKSRFASKRWVVFRQPPAVFPSILSSGFDRRVAGTRSGGSIRNSSSKKLLILCCGFPDFLWISSKFVMDCAKQSANSLSITGSLSKKGGKTCQKKGAKPPHTTVGCKTSLRRMPLLAGQHRVSKQAAAAFVRAQRTI